MRAAPAEGAGVRSALTILVPALLVPPAVLIARATGSAIVLPALATVAVYPALASQVMQGRRLAAAVAALLWATSLAACVIACTVRDPHGMETVVLHGSSYRDISCISSSSVSCRPPAEVFWVSDWGRCSWATCRSTSAAWRARVGRP